MVKSYIRLLVLLKFIVNSLSAQSTESSFQNYFNQACTYAYQNDTVMALNFFKKALVLNPYDATTHFNIGLISNILEHYDEAEKHLHQAITINPDYTKARLALATVYEETDQWEKAYKTLEFFIGHAEGDPSLLHRIKRAAFYSYRYQDAYSLCLKEMLLHPHDINLLCDIGSLATRLHNYKQAQCFFEQALKSAPNNARAHRGLAHALLAQGDFKNGWQEYEWRWTPLQHNAFALRDYLQHHSSLQGIRIRIKTEYGFGDIFQFIRYAQEYKKLGASVTIEGPKKLLPILACCAGVDRTVETGTDVISHHTDIFVMSGPLILDTTKDTIPATVPYIFPDAAYIDKWQPYFSPTTLNVGICWQADMSSTDKTILHDAHAKSIPLAEFLPLCKLSNVKLYSLQKNIDPATITYAQHIGIQLFDHFDEDGNSFMDTAAIIAQLDIIITIDTSIAHLAGAMAKPTYVLLPYTADWRWEIAKEVSPWYPTMSLVRQEKCLEWHSTIDTICKKLTHYTHT